MVQVSDMMATVVITDTVRKSAMELGTAVVHDILNDEGVKTHANTWLEKLLADQSLQQSTGQALYNSVKYAFVPWKRRKRSPDDEHDASENNGNVVVKAAGSATPTQHVTQATEPPKLEHPKLEPPVVVEPPKLELAEQPVLQQLPPSLPTAIDVVAAPTAPVVPVEVPPHQETIEIRGIVVDQAAPSSSETPIENQGQTSNVDANGTVATADKSENAQDDNVHKNVA